MSESAATTVTPAVPNPWHPSYLYKILPSCPPTPLPLALPLSELDAKDGFIHLSLASQIPTTASLFFASQTTLWLLKLDTRKTGPGGEYRPVEGLPGCAHLYALEAGRWIDIGSENVVEVRAVKRDEGHTWDEWFAAAMRRGMGHWLVDSDV